MSLHRPPGTVFYMAVPESESGIKEPIFTQLYLPRDRKFGAEAELLITIPLLFGREQADKERRAMTYAVFFNKDNLIGDVEIRQVNIVPGNIEFGNRSNVSEEETKHALADAPRLFELTFLTSKAALTSGFNTRHDPKNPHYEYLSEFASALRTRIAFRYITEDPQIEEAVQIYNKLLQHDRTEGYAANQCVIRSNTGKLQLNLDDPSPAGPRRLPASRAPQVFRDEHQFFLQYGMGPMIANESAIARNNKEVVLKGVRMILEPGQPRDKTSKFYVIFDSSVLTSNEYPNINDDEDIKVMFDHATDMSTWKGRLIKAFDSACILVDGGIDSETQMPTTAYLSENITSHSMTSGSFKDATSLDTYLATAATFTVRISGIKTLSEHNPAAQVLNDLGEFFEYERSNAKGVSCTWAFLSGQDLLIQPKINIYHGLGQRGFKTAKSGLSVPQRSFINSFSDVPGGVAWLYGPRHSGKTTTMIRAGVAFAHLDLAPEFHAPRLKVTTAVPDHYIKSRPFDGHAHMPFKNRKRDYCLIGFFSPERRNIDHVTREYHKAFSEIPDKQNVVIICAHAEQSKDSVRLFGRDADAYALLRKLHFMRENDDLAHELTKVAVLGAISMSEDRSQADLKIWEERIADHDTEMESVIFSLGFNIACVMGLVPDALKTNSEVQERLALPMCAYQDQFAEWRRTFKDLCCRVHAADFQMTNEEGTTMYEGIEIAVAHVLRHADAVVSSIKLAREYRFFMHMRLHVVLVDDATRADNIDMLSIWAYYCSAHRKIIAGDVTEPSPYAHLSSDENSFAANMKMSLFYRLIILNGYPATSLTESYTT
ncbi:hypothetical protein ANO11243_064090 [Dothideomycetidae sp. 11243]|nr:hypothetical protein ANO11243_064090 [fungal sp. No.11243]